MMLDGLQLAEGERVCRWRRLLRGGRPGGSQQGARSSRQQAWGAFSKELASGLCLTNPHPSQERLERNLSSEVPALLSGMDDASTVHAFKQAVFTHARTSLPHGWALRNVEVRGAASRPLLSLTVHVHSRWQPSSYGDVD
jgi:hypothetical protein